MRAFPDHVTERLRRLGVDPALLERGVSNVFGWPGRARQWWAGNLADDRGVIALSVGADPKGTDGDTYAVVLPRGAEPAPEDRAAFERLHPGAREELPFVVAHLRSAWAKKPDKPPAPAAGTPAPAGDNTGAVKTPEGLPASAGRITLETILPTVLVFWGRPTLGEKCELAAPEVLRLPLDSGKREIDVPSEAAWGGLYDPSRDPPLLIGAFRVCGGAQGLYVVRYPGLRVMKSLYLKGNGALDFQNPGKYDEVADYMRAAGLRWDPGLPYAPPFQLWWELVEPIECPGGAAAPNPEPAAVEAMGAESVYTEEPAAPLTTGVPGGDTPPAKPGIPGTPGGLSASGAPEPGKAAPGDARPAVEEGVRARPPAAPAVSAPGKPRPVQEGPVETVAPTAPGAGTAAPGASPPRALTPEEVLEAALRAIRSGPPEGCPELKDDVVVERSDIDSAWPLMVGGGSRSRTWIVVQLNDGRRLLYLSLLTDQGSGILGCVPISEDGLVEPADLEALGRFFPDHPDWRSEVEELLRRREVREKLHLGVARPPAGLGLDARIAFCKRRERVQDWLTQRLNEWAVGVRVSAEAVVDPELTVWEREWAAADLSHRLVAFARYLGYCGFRFAVVREAPTSGKEAYLLDGNTVVDIDRVYEVLGEVEDVFGLSEEFQRRFERNTVSLTLRELGASRSLYRSDLDPRAYLNLRDGVLDLRTLELHPPGEVPAVFTYRLDVGVRPDALRAIREGRYNVMENPIWQRFRRRFCRRAEREDGRTYLDCRDWGYLVHALGTWLSPMMHRHFAFLIGPPGVGKTTLLDILSRGVPGLVATTSLAQLETEFGLEDLVGKRILITSELTQTVVNNPGLLNKLFGKEHSITVHRKHRVATTITSMNAGMFAMNDLPEIRGSGVSTLSALYDRMSIVMMYPPEEEEEVDELLTERVPPEAALEFLLWARWVLERRGWVVLRRPEAELRALVEERSWPLRDFWEECLEENPTATVEGGPLYDAYVMWAGRHGFKALGRNNFYEYLAKRAQRRESHRAVAFDGVRLKGECGGRRRPGGWTPDGASAGPR